MPRALATAVAAVKSLAKREALNQRPTCASLSEVTLLEGSSASQRHRSSIAQQQRNINTAPERGAVAICTTMTWPMRGGEHTTTGARASLKRNSAFGCFAARCCRIDPTHDFAISGTRAGKRYFEVD